MVENLEASAQASRMASQSNIVPFPSPQPLNRRRHTRTTSGKFALLKGQHGSRVIRCLVQNVSLGGFRVVTEPYCLAGTQFTVTVLETFSAELRAVWNDSVHIGFEFATPLGDIPAGLLPEGLPAAPDRLATPGRRKADRLKPVS